MTLCSKTKDERYVLKLKEVTNSSCDEVVDCYLLGEEIKLNPKAVNNIVKNLSRSNFIKKIGKREISITDNGLRLANEIVA